MWRKQDTPLERFNAEREGATPIARYKKPPESLFEVMQRGTSFSTSFECCTEPRLRSMASDYVLHNRRTARRRAKIFKMLHMRCSATLVTDLTKCRREVQLTVYDKRQPTVHVYSIRIDVRTLMLVFVLLLVPAVSSMKSTSTLLKRRIVARSSSDHAGLTQTKMGVAVPTPLEPVAALSKEATNFFSPLVEGTGTIANAIVAAANDAHIANAALNLAALGSIVHEGHFLSTLAGSGIAMNFFGLAFDNAVLALGKTIGPGELLRQLTKGRIVLHAACVPFLVVASTQVAFLATSGVGLPSILNFHHQLVFIAIFTAIASAVHWCSYDARQLEMVDQRDSEGHGVRYCKGTLAYTSGQVLELVVPSVAATLFSGGVGTWLISVGSDAPGAELMFGALVMVGCAALRKRPDLVQWAETGLMCSLAAALMHVSA